MRSATYSYQTTGNAASETIAKKNNEAETDPWTRAIRCVVACLAEINRSYNRQREMTQNELIRKMKERYSGVKGIGTHTLEHTLRDCNSTFEKVMKRQTETLFEITLHHDLEKTKKRPSNVALKCVLAGLAKTLQNDNKFGEISQTDLYTAIYAHHPRMSEIEILLLDDLFSQSNILFEKEYAKTKEDGTALE